MSYARKNALIVAVVWSVIFIGLIASVAIPGVIRFSDPDYSLWRIVTAAIILPGFLLTAWIGVRTRKGRLSGEIDERDLAVERKASEVTLVVFAIAVFLTSLLLYETHAGNGLVSRGWLYFMAYGSAAFVTLTHAVVSLILDRRGWADA